MSVSFRPAGVCEVDGGASGARTGTGSVVAHARCAGVFPSGPGQHLGAMVHVHQGTGDLLGPGHIELVITEDPVATVDAVLSRLGGEDLGEAVRAVDLVLDGLAALVEVHLDLDAALTGTLVLAVGILRIQQLDLGLGHFKAVDLELRPARVGAGLICDLGHQLALIGLLERKLPGHDGDVAVTNAF